MKEIHFLSYADLAFINARNDILENGFWDTELEVRPCWEDALALVSEEEPEKVWVIGGGEIHKALLPHRSMCYITHVHAAPECDVFPPDLSNLSNWNTAQRERSERRTAFLPVRRVREQSATAAVKRRGKLRDQNISG